MSQAHDLETLRGLLDEVRQVYTAEDDLPDNLIPRIDEALAAVSAAEAGAALRPEWEAANATAALQALRNVRIFVASKYRHEPWAADLFRFCAEGGATSSPLRGAV
jgi:predicted NACHT family NTPase